jgi:hypothetical protein
MPRLLVSLSALILWWVPAEGQGTPGTNLSVTLEVDSLRRWSDTSQVFYVARNHPSSLEPLWRLTIEAPADPIEILHPAPADSWFVSKQYGERPVAHWGSLTGSFAAPGASSPTLSFKAIGLPAIVDAYIGGYYEPLELDADPDESVLRVGPLETHGIAVKTVGVEPLAAAATPASLTTRLTNLTSESCNLAWISSAAVCTSLNGKLQQASQALTQGDNKTARTRLRSFLNELSAQHDAQGSLPVKGNAYWLLKVNAEYVLGLFCNPDR